MLVLRTNRPPDPAATASGPTMSAQTGARSGASTFLRGPAIFLGILRIRTSVRGGEGSQRDRRSTAPILQRSSRVPRIEGFRGLQPAVVRHLRGIRSSLLAARPETRPRDVVLGGPVVLTSLAYSGFFSNGLNHDLHPRGEAPHPRGAGGDCTRDFRAPEVLVYDHCLPKYRPVSRPSQPPCDTRHEEAPAA